MANCPHGEVTKDWVWCLWETLQGTLRLLSMAEAGSVESHGQVCALHGGTGSSSPPLALSYSHLCCTLQRAALTSAPARPSRVSPRKAAATPWECIYTIFVHLTVPNSCLLFAFLLVLTYTSQALFLCLCSNTAAQFEHFEQGGTKFHWQLYNEHSKIKATFMCPHQLLDHYPKP